MFGRVLGVAVGLFRCVVWFDWLGWRLCIVGGGWFSTLLLCVGGC